MPARPRRPSLLAGSARARAVIVALVLVGLWSAVAWAVAVA